MSHTITCDTAAVAVYDEWDEFAQGPHGSLSQTSWWAEPMRPLGMDFDVVTCRRDEELVGGALIRWARPKPLPFARGTCLGGPVFSSWSPSMAAPFVDAMQAAARRRRSIEIVFIDVPDRVIQDDIIGELKRRGARFGVRSNNLHAVVDLKGRTMDDVMKGMRDRARYSIKRGRRSLRFEPLTDTASLAAAYKSFEATAARKGFAMRPPSAGIPVLREAIEREVGTVIAGIDGDNIVSAAFVTFIGDEAVYEYGGFVDSAMKLYPNHALQAEAIAMAIDRGLAGYNMGALSVKEEDAGVNEFKTGFGATPRLRTPRLQWATMPTAGRIMDWMTRSRRGQDVLRAIRRSVASRAESR